MLLMAYQEYSDTVVADWELMESIGNATMSIRFQEYLYAASNENTTSFDDEHCRYQQQQQQHHSSWFPKEGQQLALIVDNVYPRSLWPLATKDVVYKQWKIYDICDALLRKMDS